MIKVNGDFDKVKAEMKQVSKRISDDIKKIKKELKGKLTTDEKLRLQAKIKQLEGYLNLYKPSKVLPVQIDGAVFNFKLHESIMKKLKDLKTNTLTTPEGLVVQYWPSGQLAQGKGLFKLYDMSSYFKDFKNVPTGELVDGEKA